MTKMVGMSSSISESPYCPVNVVKQWFLSYFIDLSVEERISEVIFHPFEWLCFNEHCFYCCLIVNILEALVEGGWDDLIGTNPRSPVQQVVGRVGIDYITCHFRLQVPDLTLKTDLPQRVTTSGVDNICC